MARRAGKVWSPGVGWVSKREVEQRDYSSFESEWWAFLVWVIRWYPDKDVTFSGTNTQITQTKKSCSGL